MNGEPGRDLDGSGSGVAPARWRQALARNSGPIYALWGAGWIVAFALRQPEIAIPMMFGTGALAAFIEPGAAAGGVAGAPDGAGPAGADRGADRRSRMRAHNSTTTSSRSRSPSERRSPNRDPHRRRPSGGSLPR